MSMTKTLGKSDIKISAIGMGCWPIGGYFTFCGKVDCYGTVDDQESKRAIIKALDTGCNFFDTSDAYGTGHSEELLGEALIGRRNEAVLATKFGFIYDSAKRDVPGSYDVSESYVRKACEASLKRLRTDYIDLYQLHVYEIKEEEIVPMVETLEKLRTEGKIREYGWSTGLPGLARKFAENAKAASLQFSFNIFNDSANEKELLKICSAHNLAAIANSPLAMGFLSGKFNKDSKLGPDDVRGSGFDWVPYFEGGKPKQEFLNKLEAIREILTSDGRTLAQGAISWVWAQNGSLVPIAGFKNARQAAENVGAMKYGPLTTEQVDQINILLKAG